MDIPNWLLNLTDATATEFQSAEHKTPNQHTVVREQIDCPQSRESIGPKSRPGREFRAYRRFRPRESCGTLSERIVGPLYHSSRRFIPSKIIIASTQRPGRTLRGAPSLFSLVPPTARRQFPTAGTAQVNAILVRCEEASMRPRGRRLAGRGRSDRSRGTSAAGARPDSAIRCGRAVTYGIAQRADGVRSASARRVGTAAI
jgi:hypothetical protein